MPTHLQKIVKLKRYSDQKRQALKEALLTKKVLIKTWKNPDLAGTSFYGVMTTTGMDRYQLPELLVPFSDGQDPDAFQAQHRDAYQMLDEYIRVPYRLTPTEGGFLISEGCRVFTFRALKGLASPSKVLEIKQYLFQDRIALTGSIEFDVWGLLPDTPMLLDNGV